MGYANEAARGREDGPDRGQDGGQMRGADRQSGRQQRELERAAAREAAEEAASACAEHLLRDLARVRARFGMDLALPRPALDAAWTTDVIEEEDEAELVDALADCVGAGLSLESALTSWDSGALAADDEDAADDDELTPPLSLAIARGARGGRRVYVR